MFNKLFLKKEKISNNIYVYLNRKERECIQDQTGHVRFNKLKVISRVKTGNRNCENMLFLKLFET